MVYPFGKTILVLLAPLISRLDGECRFNSLLREAPYQTQAVLFSVPLGQLDRRGNQENQALLVHPEQLERLVILVRLAKLAQRVQLARSGRPAKLV